MFRHRTRSPNDTRLIVQVFHLKSTYRYIDVLRDFVTGYNDTVHNATGMALAQVSDKDVLAIWRRMRERVSRVRPVKAKYGTGQLVRISKEKAKFAKRTELQYGGIPYR